MNQSKITSLATNLLFSDRKPYPGWTYKTIIQSIRKHITGQGRKLKLLIPASTWTWTVWSRTDFKPFYLDSTWTWTIWSRAGFKPLYMLPVPGSQFVGTRERGRTRVQEQGGSGKADGRSKPLAFSALVLCTALNYPYWMPGNSHFMTNLKRGHLKYCTLLGRSEGMLSLG